MRNFNCPAMFTEHHFNTGDVNYICTSKCEQELRSKGIDCTGCCAKCCGKSSCPFVCSKIRGTLLSSNPTCPDKQGNKCGNITTKVSRSFAKSQCDGCCMECFKADVCEHRCDLIGELTSEQLEVVLAKGKKHLDKVFDKFDKKTENNKQEVGGNLMESIIKYKSTLPIQEVAFKFSNGKHSEKELSFKEVKTSDHCVGCQVSMRTSSYEITQSITLDNFEKILEKLNAFYKDMRASSNV